jgi:hypothetical protein
MQVSRRSLSPDTIDYEFIWLSVSVVSVGMAAVWFAVGLPWPRCLFHDLTGLPCLTCGMTRAAIQFFHGHFLKALWWNPLVFIGLCGLSIFNIYAFAVLILRAPRLRIRFNTEPEKRTVRFLVLAALISNWAYLLSHWRRF